MSPNLKKAICICLLLPTIAFPSTGGDKPLETFASEVIKRQIKKELESFLNTHPKLVGSSNTQLGTEAMRYVGAALSLYNFFTAETDKQRLYAAGNVGVAFSPEPYSAMVLMAIQMVDMAITMEHQKDIAKIYEEIREAQLYTLALLEQIYTHEYNEQKRIIEAIQKTTDSITSAHEVLAKDPVMLYLSEQTNTPPTLKQAEQCMLGLNEMHQLLLDYKMLRVLFNGYVDTERVPEFKDLAKALDEFEENYADLANSIGATLDGARMFFSSLSARQKKFNLQKKVSSHTENIEKYVHCSNAVNRTMSAHLLGQDFMESPELFDYKRFAEDCVEHFDWRTAW